MVVTASRSPRDNPRTRPAKTPLSHEAVVSAALAVIDGTGCASVTMRRVAQVLETGPASLYAYVTDRDELMAQAYDLALSGVVLPTDADGDWRARLELLVDRVITELSHHSDIAVVALTGMQTGRHSLRITEETLRLLREAGVEDETCSWAADLIDQFVTSSALERAAWLRAQHSLSSADSSAQAMSQAARRELDAVFDTLPPSDYPTIHSLRGVMTTGGDGKTRAEWKLRIIIDGLLAHRGGPPR